MKIELTTQNISPLQFCKRAMFLAYQASVVGGMGFLQARNVATEDQVWENITHGADYPAISEERQAQASRGEFYADYVFGRMMKLNISFNDKTIVINPTDFRPDYQSFSRKYPSPDSLVEAVFDSFVEVTA